MFNENEEDIFASIDKVDARGQRNPYLIEGDYLLEVEKIQLKKARDRRVFYLVEAKILESNNAERPIGMTVSWMTDVDQDMGPINIKRFLAACIGIDPNSEEANTQVTSAAAKLSVSDEQPLTGEKVYVSVVATTTKSGKPFSEHRWQPVA